METEKFDENVLPPLQLENLAVIERQIQAFRDLFLRKIPPSDEIQVTLTDRGLNGLEDLLRYAKTYKALYHRHSADRNVLLPLLRSTKTARDILYPAKEQKPKASLSSRRIKALKALGFPDSVAELARDYEFLWEQFQIGPWARTWFHRVPFDLQENYRSFFESTEAVNTPVTWLRQVCKHGVVRYEKMYETLTLTEIKTRIIEVLKDKYNYRTLDAVHRALARSGVKGLPRVS